MFDKLMDADNDRLLRLLEAHGQSFLDSFPLTSNDNRKRKNNTSEERLSKKRSRMLHVSKDPEEEAEGEVWHGISQNLLSDQGFKNERNVDDSDFEQSDHESTTESRENQVVVFSEPGPKKFANQDPVSKAQMKTFMSSKVSKLTSYSAGLSILKETSSGDDEERSNAQNDALLHQIVHTKLLSGSLDPELDMSPATRRKVLAGRILELSGEAKLGKGERLVRETEKNRAAKRVREGIAHKQKDRGKKELEEAKNLGNYHPTIKKVFGATASIPSTRKRGKGLKMGVGKFRNGSLMLSRDDFKMVTGGSGEASWGRERDTIGNREKLRKRK